MTPLPLEAVLASTDLPGVLRIDWADNASRNAVGASVARRITAQLDEATDHSVRAVVLGAGQSPYCSGWDVRDLAGLDTSSRDQVADYFRTGRELLRALESCPVPVVSVVRGLALGFGCSLLAHSDLVIADAEAQFGLPEVRRGFPPATVVPELLGAVDAREVNAWALTGSRYDAIRASTAGLVHRVAPPGRLSTALAEVLDDLSACEPLVLRQTKALLREQRAMPLSERRERGVAVAVDHFCK